MDVLGFLLLFMGLHLVHTHSVSTSEEKIVICRPRDLASVFSEDPHIFHEGSCPTTPAPDEVPRNACHQCECWSDANCDEQEKCCYNGCKNTCVDSVIVAPAAVIDWLDEPPRQRTAGNAWLIPGPEEPYADIEQSDQALARLQSAGKFPREPAPRRSLKMAATLSNVRPATSAISKMRVMLRTEYQTPEPASGNEDIFIFKKRRMKDRLEVEHLFMIARYTLVWCRSSILCLAQCQLTIIFTESVEKSRKESRLTSLDWKRKSDSNRCINFFVSSR
ncbi:putative WAP four-disulfide core domain protein 1 [Apostichopus japonicus]|uniref:Putative WAP four-disulfide core domain protein 1 n=1 Tax=Stichopus japonicus TaxID=307972 RepID=A0A2G8JLA8_STIJA|nr:putative WAP four-disulfide core domain protein 1 [Apostichopus japonicus]